MQASESTLTTIPQASTTTDKREAHDGDVVTVHYRGTLESGEEFDSSLNGDPLTFILGSGKLISGFDNAVRGMANGEKVTVTLAPGEAYGERREDLIFELPRDTAPKDLSVGSRVQLANGLPATIAEITDRVVILDANHRLAGQTLTFEIEVLSIKREND